MDIACSFTLLGLVAILGTTYLGRLVWKGRAQSSRVDKEGKSALVGKSAMEMFYWGIEPIAATCARIGISANAISWSSLFLGFAAGAALAFGHFGLGAAIACLSAAGDALDGLVARRTDQASNAGEVLDAAIDRYVELALLGGLAIYLRANAVALVMTLLAIGASFMVSYSSAKAEALHVTPPRGSMRRMERSILVIAGCALTPLLGFFGGSTLFRDAPILVALFIIAAAGNVSAVRRFVHIGETVK